MSIQQRILKIVTYTNWTLLIVFAVLGATICEPLFARGLIFGGLLITANFHLLARTLKKTLDPKRLGSHGVVIAKYYIRFVISGVVIFFLIANHYVDPIGLIIGLSIVVFSIVFATLCEVKKLIFKEAV